MKTQLWINSTQILIIILVQMHQIKSDSKKMNVAARDSTPITESSSAYQPLPNNLDYKLSSNHEITLIAAAIIIIVSEVIILLCTLCFFISSLTTEGFSSASFKCFMKQRVTSFSKGKSSYSRQTSLSSSMLYVLYSL